MYGLYFGLTAGVEKALVPAEARGSASRAYYTAVGLAHSPLDVHFTSPVPVYGLLGARASSPLLKQAGRLRSQGTGSAFTKQTSSLLTGWLWQACGAPVTCGTGAALVATAIMTSADWTLCFTWPWSGAMLVLSILSFGYSLWQRRQVAALQTVAAGAEEEAAAPSPMAGKGWNEGGRHTKLVQTRLGHRLHVV